MKVNIVRIHIISYYKVIVILDVIGPYPTLLGIYWDFFIIMHYLMRKKEYSIWNRYTMSGFSIESQGRRELYRTREGWYKTWGGRENLQYHWEKIILCESDKEIRWRSICSFDTKSEESMERWKNQLYEMSNERCERIIKSMHWIGSKLHHPLNFDGNGLVDY